MICNRCKVDQPEDQFFFSQSRGKRDPSWCKTTGCHVVVSGRGQSMARRCCIWRSSRSLAARFPAGSDPVLNIDRRFRAHASFR